jgi:tryptophanyl-tRNA synthetase
MLASVARLERVPTYKDQAQQLNLQPSLGLLVYPVLQAADILSYKANTVPVGEDQLPHIELAREIARRFNQTYRPVFPEPEPLLSKTTRLPGVDNRAMHTSYGNAIYLGDSPEETTRKVLGMYTDPSRIHASDTGHVEGNPVFAYLEIFNPNLEEVEEFKLRYRAGKVGDVELKQRLAEVLNAYLASLRELRATFVAQPKMLMEILETGTERARLIARQTFEEVRDCMGLKSQLSAGYKDVGHVNGAFC